MEVPAIINPPPLNPNEIVKSTFMQITLYFDSENTKNPIILGTGSIFITNEYFSFILSKAFNMEIR